jgi:quercetin dioxygenase-like cupin family protein
MTVEPVSRSEHREILILFASPALTVTWSRYAGGQAGPDLHVHREHTDAFYVLEGELTFRVGPGGETVVRASPGTFVAVPPNVVHAFVNEGPGEARWLNYHAPDNGFADYLRDGTGWDSFDAPPDGGRPANDVVVTTWTPPRSPDRSG